MSGTKLASLLGRELANFPVRPNKIYAVSINMHGKITKFDMVGEQSPIADEVKPIDSLPSEIDENKLDTCVDKAIQFTQKGTMVFSIEQEGEEYKFNKLGEGFIVYERSHISVHTSVESAVLSALEILSYGLQKEVVLKYKRRQGKWFVHEGLFANECPKEFSKKTRVYDLTNRIHVSFGVESDD